MKLLRRLISHAAVIASLAIPVAAAEAPMSAKDIAAKLSALQQDGASFARFKVGVKPGGISLQLQVKQRRSPGSTELVYQIIWPKERAGEAVLLRQSPGKPASGFRFTPPNVVVPLKAGQMNEQLFGMDLTYADVLENFFAWDNQTIAGEETVGGFKCWILESKPAKGTASGSSSVRTWVDVRRMVPLRVEKYSSAGGLVRRIDTTEVAADDLNRIIPANLTIQTTRRGSVTEIDGSKLKHGAIYTDRDFSPEGMADLTPPKTE